MADTVSSAYTRWIDAIAALSGHRKEEADRLCSQAVSYVWGFQDAGGEVKNTERSTEFGYAYGIVAARCAAGLIGMRPPIQDAWKSWQEHGEIRDYNGKPLDRDSDSTQPTLTDRNGNAITIGDPVTEYADGKIGPVSAGTVVGTFRVVRIDAPAGVLFTDRYAYAHQAEAVAFPADVEVVTSGRDVTPPAERRCGYCNGLAREAATGYEHADDGDRVNVTAPGDFVSAAHNKAGTPIGAYDIVEGGEDA